VNRLRWRRWKSNAMVALMVLAVLLAVLPLFLILATLVVRGASSLNPAFFLNVPAPVGESGGGVSHAIVGTLMIVGVAALMGLPIGIGAGIFSAEFPRSKLATTARFVADVLNGTPSIVVGVVAWALIVARQKHFSGFAGSVALAFLMIPMVMRTTEEMIKLVPHSLREAALGPGPRLSPLAHQPRRGAPDLPPGHRDRQSVGDRADRGRDRAAPLHGARQPVHESQHGPADGGVATHGLHLRHRPL